MSDSKLPTPLVTAGVLREHVLDVRPILAKGGDPFALILKTVQALDPSVALHLVLDFEPAPLYRVLAGFGRKAHVEKSDERVEVWFYAEAGAAPVDPHDAREPLLPPVALDVRGLEPPQPMIAILEKLVALGPGAQLTVRHHREPVMLYDKLALRGYAARCTPQPEGDFLVHIAPAWVFEERRA